MTFNSQVWHGAIDHNDAIVGIDERGEVVWELHNEIPRYRDNCRTAVYRAMFCPPERAEPYL